MADYVFTGANVPLETYYDDVIGDSEVPVEETNQEVTFETADGELQPVYVKTYGGDSYGKHTNLHDGCGNNETVNGGATGFQITVEGILTLEQLRKANELNLHKGTEVTITLQPWTRTYICDDFTWDKPNDLNKWYSPEYPDGVEAYTFQIQTKDPTEETQ